MYHIELRQFPHNAWRFNLTEQDLRAVVGPWVREQIVEVGERKWSPHQAKLTILEGPQLDVAQLSMGRGWRAAQRGSQDVTEHLLALARQAAQAAHALQAASRSSTPSGAPDAGAPDVGSPGSGSLGDPVTLGLLADLRSVATLLAPEAIALLDAWRAAAARSPGLAPSESLALAEQSLASAGEN
jgi:hypothetical protein